MIEGLQQRFQAFAGCRAAIFFAPGRINLIGEHTDYSGGFVLPASIDLGIWVAVGPRDDEMVRVRSEAQDETTSFNLRSIDRTEPTHWSNYVKGVAWALQRQGHSLRGAELLIAGDVPLGSGLSSSAALEVAVASALLARAGEDLPPMRLAQLCQAAENDFVGMRCGLMDQFASLHGLRHRALLLNCGSLEWRPVALPAGYSWVVANTMVHHAHASGEYNTRRAEWEELSDRLHVRFPEHRYVHELDDEQLAQVNAGLPASLSRRLRHIASENRRVREAVAALETNQPEVVGGLLNASHRSLRDDFQVSCAELDLMVELALQLPGVLGARMLGGGFGGCTLSLVRDATTPAFVAALQQRYRLATQIEPWIHVCAIEDGARRVA